MIDSALVVHYIDDMDQALSFYKTALGLTPSTESPGWSTLRVTEGLELALHIRGDGEGRGAGSADVHPFDAFETTLVLFVGDLEACCDRITDQGGSLDRVLEPRDGIPIRMALVRDPSGNGFQVNQFVT